MLVFGGGLIAAGMFGTVWWRERPLREAETFLQRHDSAQALLIVEPFLQRFPDHSQAHAIRARALVDSGRAAEAVRIFDRIGAASPAEIRSCAKAYLMVERWIQALPLLEYLLHSRPDDADLLHEVSACRAKLGRFDEAISSARRFAEIPGSEARGQLLIGTLERERQNYRKAREAWARVVVIDPTAGNLQIPADEFFLEYGSVLLQTGEPSLALAHLERSLSIRPTSKAHSALGKALSQLGRAAEADTAWQKALADDPEDETACQGLAESAIRRTEFSAALEYLKPLSGSSQLTSATAFLFQRCYSLTGDRETAALWQSEADRLRKLEELQHTVDQVLIENPASVWGQILRSYRLAEQGSWEQARILLDPIVASGGHHPFADQLHDAIQNRRTLPGLDQLPVELF